MPQQSLLLPRLADLQPATDRAIAFYRRSPRTIIVASVFALTTPWLVQNYRAFIALGPGGIPHNVFGWIAALLLKPLGRETLSTDQYDRDPNKDSWLKEHGGLPRRQRVRPKTGWHFAPHRQIEQFPPAIVAASFQRTFRKIIADNPTLVEVQTSLLEKRGDAMTIHSTIPTPHAAAKLVRREIVHIHLLDDSLHVTLAPQDCKLVIEQGWGERHPLSGGSAIPKEYLLIYAPNTEEEVEIVGRVIKASVGYMTGSRQVN